MLLIFKIESAINAKKYMTESNNYQKILICKKNHNSLY